MSTCRLEMLEELKSMGMQTLQLDVTSHESISAAVAAIEEADGRIDALVCNAGHWPFLSCQIWACRREIAVLLTRRK